MTDGKTAWGNSAIRNQGARFKEKNARSGTLEDVQEIWPRPIQTSRTACRNFPRQTYFFDCANLVNSIHKWVCSLALNPLSLVVIRTITDLFRWCIREFLVKLTKVNSYPPTNGIRVKSASQARGLHLGMRNDPTGA